MKLDEFKKKIKLKNEDLYIIINDTEKRISFSFNFM